MINEVIDNSKYNTFLKSKKRLSIVVIILLLIFVVVIFGHKQNTSSLIDVHDEMVEATGITKFRQVISEARSRTRLIFIAESTIILLLSSALIWGYGSRNYYYKRQKFLEHQIKEEIKKGGVCSDFDLKIQRLEEEYNNGNRK